MRRLVGALLLTLAALGGCSVPAPSGTAAPTAPAAAAAPAEVPAMTLDVPTISAHSSLQPLGITTAGALEVPDVHHPEQAGWYQASPIPGQVGPAVLLGHVNGDHKDGVFARLAKLKKGDRATVTVDGAPHVFEVYKVESDPKDAFPTDRVYGDTPGPELRLITCGGVFDASARSYKSNIIAFARQVTA